jgi:hypothetical protein
MPAMRILLSNDDGILAPGLAAMRHELAKLGEVLKDLNSHLVQQSIPLMERNIPWQDLTNLEKMTSGWDDTWPYYVPAAKLPSDLSKPPGASDPALSPADAKELWNAAVLQDKGGDAVAVAVVYLARGERLTDI